MNLQNLIEKRNTEWENAKKFVNEKRDENGILSKDDAKKYLEMEDRVKNLGFEIERIKDMEEIERQMNTPINKAIKDKPFIENGNEKTGRKTDEYRLNFWNVMRAKVPAYSVMNALQIGVDSEGGFLVPDEFENTLIESLEEENIFRTLAKVIKTSSGERKIPVVASKGSANWIDEEGPYIDSDDSFSQVTIGAFKLGTTIKVSEELINDSMFDLESYISKEFARRIGNREEEAFFKGDGNGKPLGILANTGGAEIGVTAKSSTSITADELIDLFYSLKSPYRKNAVWILNDSTIKEIRKLKDSNGQYLWQASLVAGSPDTILGRPVKTSSYMDEMGAAKKTVAFGDFSYYWIADRQGRSFKRLNELYATTGQIGFLGSERVDGKLILSEAIKVLKQGSAK